MKAAHPPGVASPPLVDLSRADLECEVSRLRSLLKESDERRERSLARLAKNTREFWLPRTVPRRRATDMSALEFVRDYIATSQPLVLTGLTEREWPCLRLWRDDEYLLKVAGDVEVSVNITPNGRADSVDQYGFFVKPCEERMPFREFWETMTQTDNSHSSDVLYLSRQNDSLRAEFPQLMKDVPPVVPLALEAFGCEPEAVNLWIGDDRSVSSCHMDHYDNMYIVVRGEKVFTLLPPAAVPFLHERRCPPATFERRGKGETLFVRPDAWQGGGQVMPDIPWIPFDVAETQNAAEFPYFARYGQDLSVEVRLRPGEMLYLPATWYHRVAQEGLTVAVNYWHDMRFGHGYVHHKFLRCTMGLDRDDGDDTSEDSDNN